jgi:hypothetical protein
VLVGWTLGLGALAALAYRRPRIVARRRSAGAVRDPA